MHPDAPPKTTSFNVIDAYKHLPLEELKEIADSHRLPFAVAMANITGDLNTGVIIRTACVFGAEKVFIFGRRKYDRRSTVGAHHYIDVISHTTIQGPTDEFDWSSMLHTIRVNGYTPVLIEQGGVSLDRMDVSLHSPICLVFGAEDTGIPASVCDAEICYSIPQAGILRSLNVSTAAGIAMWHVARQLMENP